MQLVKQISEKKSEKTSMFFLEGKEVDMDKNVCWILIDRRMV
jgi:hypothetical protein